MIQPHPVEHGSRGRWRNKKRERPHHGCSPKPPPRGNQNSAWPTLPLAGSDRPALLLVFEGRSPSWRFFGEAELTFASRRVVRFGRFRPWFFLLRCQQSLRPNRGQYDISPPGRAMQYPSPTPLGCGGSVENRGRPVNLGRTWPECRTLPPLGPHGRRAWNLDPDGNRPGNVVEADTEVGPSRPSKEPEPVLPWSLPLHCLRLVGRWRSAGPRLSAIPDQDRICSFDRPRITRCPRPIPDVLPQNRHQGGQGSPRNKALPPRPEGSLKK